MFQKVGNKMTRAEIVNFLSTNTNCFKKDLTTIKDIIANARKEGYLVIKRGIDNYEIRESCAITDFTKPLKIIRDVPIDSEFEVYNKVPLAQVAEDVYFGALDIGLYCYLCNKNTGDNISFIDLEGSVERIAKNFDLMTSLGYLYEQEDCIEFYVYPNENKKHIRPFKYLQID